MSSELIVTAASCCALAAIAIILLYKSRCRESGQGEPTKNEPPKHERPDDERIFYDFLERHEKRILAFLIEEEARRCSLDRDAVMALRRQFGTELVRPAYDIQDQLGRRGIGPLEVTRLQKEWIIRNGGDPNRHPATREVEKILFSRNQEKAVSICRGRKA